MVRKWVASFAAHAVTGLARKHSHHDAHFRLSVFERMWKDGLSRRQTAVLFDIRSVGCLSVWESNMNAAGLQSWLHAREAGPEPCLNHLRRTPGHGHRRG
jgi:transposase